MYSRVFKWDRRYILVDSSASECFISAIFAEQHEFKMRKTKEKLKIQFADSTERVSNLIVE